MNRVVSNVFEGIRPFPFLVTVVASAADTAGSGTLIVGLSTVRLALKCVSIGNGGDSTRALQRIQVGLYMSI